jgi:hypothetical protein
MGWITTTYEEIELKTIVKVPCNICKKIRTRTLKVSQTINPFNKKDGVIKDRITIHEENRDNLEVYRKETLRDGITCNTCYKDS